MLAKAILSLNRALILVVLAVALTATGFAHRTPSAQDGALAFALANGAGAADFCGGVPGKDGTATVHCPACQITAGADLPAPAGHPIKVQLAVLTDADLAQTGLVRPAVRDPAHGPQGPPVA